MINYDNLINDLWTGEKAVCFFVHNNSCHWVVDHLYNYSLDAEPEYKAYLDKGHISNEQYEAACLHFRGGVLKLDKTTFDDYLKNDST